MVTDVDAGTVLITGPTGGLGLHATVAMASRPAHERPDLLLLGRPGSRLSEVAAQVRAAGARAHEVGCDLASLADVRAAAVRVKDLLAEGAVRPLRAIVANAGLSGQPGASADGYEMTFAVNYLAHAQLVGDLLDALTPTARIVLLGSNTYYANWVRRLLAVPPASWRDPLELARPGDPATRPTMKSAGVAYSNSKLALLYYAHELQRRAPDGVGVAVFEPGFMPGTGLSRNFGPGAQRLGQRIERLHIRGVTSPATSGPALASVALDEKWAHLRGGAFVLVDREIRPQPIAFDREREARLWEATAELLGADRS